jgi:AAA family ATP:ADP antiporter
MRQTHPGSGPLSLVNLRPGEGKAFVWSSLTFFCLLASYYILRPLRDAKGLEGGIDILFWFYMATLATTLVASPLFAALVSRTPRRVFVPAVFRFCLVNLLLFWALFTFLPSERRLPVIAVFFVWVTVFGIFVVSVFWGLMADLYRSEQGKRLFAFIGVGGTLGGIVGASITTQLAEPLGPTRLLFPAMLLLEAAAQCIRVLTRAVGPGETVGGGGPAAPVTPDGEREHRTAITGPENPGLVRSALEGIRLVLRSPYLAGICLYMLLYAVSSTFLWFTQARIVSVSLLDEASRTVFFGRIDQWVNILTVIVQIFLAGRILPAIGVGATLSLLPLVTGTGFGVLAVAPGLSTVAVFMVVRRAANFSLARPAREVLYTVVGRGEKYQAKNFIDTFVYRGGDALGAIAERALNARSPGTGAVALAMVPLAAVWLVVSLMLGTRQRRLEARGAF